MKKLSFLLKIVCAFLLFAFGILILIFGADGRIGGDYYYRYTNYQSDAAAIQALGSLVEGIVSQLYILGGFICMIIAMYWIACTLATVDKKMLMKTETSLDTLSKYKNLFDSGVISQEEFETMKKHLLGL